MHQDIGSEIFLNTKCHCQVLSSVCWNFWYLSPKLIRVGLLHVTILEYCGSAESPARQRRRVLCTLSVHFGNKSFLSSLPATHYLIDTGEYELYARKLTVFIQDNLVWTPLCPHRFPSGVPALAKTLVLQTAAAVRSRTARHGGGRSDRLSHARWRRTQWTPAHQTECDVPPIATTDACVGQFCMHGAVTRASGSSARKGMPGWVARSGGQLAQQPGPRSLARKPA